ncbi:hypothetical protein EET67_22025 [Pseudaminobacter arsenicus]|uniref:Uncharacterized protein n=1 Tax=Borborobacter arsenicus TaxID=1851146 RepID=A0A432V0F5_9HYPH|nr:hypothetical protein [Pseudaminobacter arsenicus]RUM95640.1 hypothetical protein EET67_22025 [Pseudaminobacter arsenicus]
MKWNEFTFTEPRNIGRWKSAYEKDDGPGLSQQADDYFRACVTLFAELLSQIGDAMVGQMSRAADPVTDLYRQRKENAAVLDFDDLLQRAHERKRQRSIRSASGTFPFIFPLSYLHLLDCRSY